MSTQIKYKGRAVVAFESGTAILRTNGEKLEGDLEIMSTGGGGDKFKTMVDGSITEVTAEDLQGIDRIRAYAFAGAGIKTATIPDNITQIGGQSFMYSALRNIHIGNGTTSIGLYSFVGCNNLTDVDIGSGVTKIESRVFGNCPALKTITCRATTPPTLASDAFYNTDTSGILIYVPEESVDAYKAATNWAAYRYNIFPIGASIIFFTFDGFSGIAEKGMTWADWVGSSHNMYGGMIVGNYVSLMDKTLVLTTDGATAYVTKDQEIIGGINYTLVANPNAVNFTIGQYPYTILESKTFQQLIDENYYGGEFYAEDGYVGSYAVGGLLYKDGNKVPVTYQIQNGDTFTVSA